METTTFKGDAMIEINNSIITVFEACYLLSNNKGYMDGDKKCLVITKN